ncbi:hypothetical protein L484_011979 [Morus notabilis]|uniref:Uncharacterized protein n=1 Tax=Morus notabilis TaxID=981085 RepID=W9S5Y0_9ROSA|nr:hypothetical protein L484_011979 [Morus notabilis]
MERKQTSSTIRSNRYRRRGRAILAHFLQFRELPVVEAVAKPGNLSGVSFTYEISMRIVALLRLKDVIKP